MVIPVQFLRGVEGEGGKQNSEIFPKWEETYPLG